MVGAKRWPPMKATWRGDKSRLRFFNLAGRPIGSPPPRPSGRAGNLSQQASPWQAEVGPSVDRPSLAGQGCLAYLLVYPSPCFLRGAAWLKHFGGGYRRKDF